MSFLPETESNADFNGKEFKIVGLYREGIAEVAPVSFENAYSDMLIEHYKKDFDYMDLNGITGDFTNTNPYKGLDEFKLGFNPLTFEYIGEYDFIINEGLYKSMEQSGQLAKEFKRKEKSISTN